MKKRSSLETLIANDIVHYGMDMANDCNFVIDIDDYIKEFNKSSKEYILNNIDNILDEIGDNENIANYSYDENSKEINMTFYINGMLESFEKLILYLGNSIDKELDFEDIKCISNKLYHDEDLVDGIITTLAKYKGDYVL